MVLKFCAFLLLLCTHFVQVHPSSSAKKLPTARILSLKGIPHSRTSMLLQWSTNRPLLSDSSFVVRYGFDKSTDFTEVPTNSENLNYTISDLEPHTFYRFQVAPKERGVTGQFSVWKRVALDISSYIVKVQLPSETKSTFQKALHDVLPLSYLTSNLLNSTKIDLDTSMVEAFYEIFFNIDVNITGQQLTNMFARNHARSHTSYVRNIRVSTSRFCNTGRHRCHELAQCLESFGTYHCKCRSDYVDVNTRSHQFPGRNCSLNTDEPGEMVVKVINKTTVHVRFRAPRQRLGKITFYELQYSTVSGDPPSGVQDVDIDRHGAYLEKFIHGLAPNNLHKFRARALTRIAPGKWTLWKQVRTVSNQFKVTFDLQLKRSFQNYPAKQPQVHKDVANQAENALRVSRTVSMTNVQVIRSDFLANNTIRFQILLYTKHVRWVDLNRIKNAAVFRLKGRFTSKFGSIDKDSIIFEDFDECANNFGDCAGNGCTNKVGTYACQCPDGLVDIGSDFDLFAGRLCIVFDSPLAFTISLINPRTAKLNWKIPPQMRKKKLFFWFVVQYKLKNNETVTDRKVDLPKEDFTGENYIVSTIVKNLQMASVYQFRVAVANVDNVGRYSSWKQIETSNLIFNAKLNLTLVVYSPNLLKKNHALASETADRVRSVVSNVLSRIPQYTATGNVVFTTGIRDRTFAYAYLFFNKNGNIQPKQIQEAFKHNSIFDSTLGIDFDTVNVTDFNECNSTWSDCSAHAQCINKSPGFSCTCEEEYVDFSADENRKPGRICIHPDDITTAPPTTTAEETTVGLTTVALRYPQVVLSGDAVSPTKIRITWQRQVRSSQQSFANIDYIIRYGVKGLPARTTLSAASTTLSVDISDLHRGVIYQLQVAEKEKQSSRPHTFFSLPIEVRTNPRAFRVFIQLPDISASSTIISSEANPQRDRLKTFVSDYFSELYNHADVKNKFNKILFGSVGHIAFSTHPDRGVIASAVIYVVQKSKATRTMMGQAYVAGEKLVHKPITITYMYIGDLDECSSDALNDCSPTSQCSNTIGSFRCSCDAGLTDMGPTYFLLPGRLCLSPHTSSTTQTTRGTTSTAHNKQFTEKTSSTTSVTTTLIVKTTTKQPLAVLKPANLLGLSSGECAKGQKLLRSNCQDVDLYLGRINVLKESGNDVTASNLLGEGGDFLREAVETALAAAFTEMEKMSGFFKSRVQNLTVVDGKIQALFVIVMNSQNLRHRRQVNFILDDFEINAEFIKTAFRDYLNEQYPVGNVNPLAGAAIVFGIDDILISDINECSSRSLYDCDVNHADCINIMGSFTCECQNGTSDVSSDVISRPGRRCRDQCNPSPCLNGARCIPQSQVGQAACACAQGFEGELCSKVVESEDNLVVIALSSVAGVLFLFLVCFIVTYHAHRKNKRKDKMKMNTGNIQQGETDAYLSTDSNFTNSNDGVGDGDEFETTNAILQPVENVTNQTEASCSDPPTSPPPFAPPAPPIPARTMSIQSDGVRSCVSTGTTENQSPTTAKPVRVPSFHAPCSANEGNPSVPKYPPQHPQVRTPRLKKPSLPPPRQPHNLATVSDPQPPACRLPSQSSQTVAIPPASSVSPPNPPREKDCTPTAAEPKTRKKKSKKAKNIRKPKAIRGRIRRHSDESMEGFR